jgi:hypothetical protein
MERPSSSYMVVHAPSTSSAIRSGRGGPSSSTLPGGGPPLVEETLVCYVGQEATAMDDDNRISHAGTRDGLTQTFDSEREVIES